MGQSGSSTAVWFYLTIKCFFLCGLLIYLQDRYSATINVPECQNQKHFDHQEETL